MKYIGYTLLLFVAFFLLSALLWGLGVAMGIISLAPHNITNKVQMNHDIIDATVNAKNCLQWQDWFRTSEGNIKTLSQTEQNAQEALDQFNQNNSKPLTDMQQQEQMVLLQNISGAKNEANDAINTYDAKAKQENLAYCKDGLPLFIHPF